MTKGYEQLLGFCYSDSPVPTTRSRSSLQPRRKPAQARSRQTVEVILVAAARVFAAAGYAGTTTNHIAEEAGVSVGSLYEYFPNKDALLAALMEAHVREGEEILAKVAEAAAHSHGADVRPVVRLFVEAMVALHGRDRALHRVLFEEAPLPPRIRRRIGEIERRASAYVEAYLRADAGRTRRNPALAARIVVQTIEGLTHRLVIHRERDADVDATLEEMIDLIAAYLAAPRGAPGGSFATAPRNRL